MAGMVLVVANGDWPSNELVETLLDNAEFTIALDGAADRFEGWDVVVGDLDSIANSDGIEKDDNQENSDLAKALIEYEVDAVVGIEGGRLDHRLAAFTALFESQSDAILYFEGWRACRVADSGLEIELQKGTICSVMALGKVENVRLQGVEFGLSGEDLSSGTRGVGNKSISSEVSISHDGGDLLFIWEANEL
jgi:thiamine pyrophosphokinase